MKQFEYKKEELIGATDLTELGLQGWELVAIYNSVMYFKRELKHVVVKNVGYEK